MNYVDRSELAAGLGLAVASGGTALGSLKVEQRPVLYLALEDGHRRLQGAVPQDHVQPADPEGDERDRPRSEPRGACDDHRVPRTPRQPIAGGVGPLTCPRRNFDVGWG